MNCPNSKAKSPLKYKEKKYVKGGPSGVGWVGGGGVRLLGPEGQIWIFFLNEPSLNRF